MVRVLLGAVHDLPGVRGLRTRVTVARTLMTLAGQVALQCQPNMTLISEEIREKQISLEQIVRPLRASAREHLSDHTVCRHTMILCNFASSRCLAVLGRRLRTRGNALPCRAVTPPTPRPGCSYHLPGAPR